MYNKVKIILVVSLASCLSMLTIGCTPNNFIRFQRVGETSVASTTAVLMRSGATGNATEMRRAGGLAGTVQYNFSANNRAFLLQGNIRNGISAGQFLHLPIDNAATATPSVVPLTGAFPTNWTSFRVYDSGLCSVFIPWTNPPSGGIAELLISSLDAAVTGSSAVVGGMRMGPARVTPILKSERLGSPVRSGRLDEREDRIRVVATYNAARVENSDGIGCDNKRISIDMTIGWEPVMGIVSHAPQCTSPSEPGGTATIDGSTDFNGVILARNISINETSGCLVDNIIRDQIETAVDGLVPGTIANFIRNRLRVNPRLLGITDAGIRDCTCDIQCDAFAADGPAYPGRRHVCRLTSTSPLSPAGECDVQIEPDYINARPDGIEVVIVPDASDPQAGLITGAPTASAFCAAGRNGIPVGGTPIQGRMPGAISVP